MRNKKLTCISITLAGILTLGLSTGIYYALIHEHNTSKNTDSTVASAAKKPIKSTDNKNINPPVTQGKINSALQKNPNSSSPANWQEKFNDFSKTLGAPAGLALAPMGAKTALDAGTLKSQVAWSTSKVPVSIAALNEGAPTNTLNANIAAAITASNNSAAQAVYDTLGGPNQAKTKIEQVLHQAYNANVSVPTARLRSGFTIFGQTEWSIADQAVFAANLKCLPNSGYVYGLMGQVITSQRWGLGQLPGSHFKGGWGPVNGGYLVRQFGVVEISGQPMGIAIITLAPSFGRGTQILNQIANWAANNIAPMAAISNC